MYYANSNGPMKESYWFGLKSVNQDKVRSEVNILKQKKRAKIGLTSIYMYIYI